MAEIDLMDLYPKTRRNVDDRSLASMEDRALSLKFGKEYFDGTRRQGCGGYFYDGRWKPVVRRIIQYYGLTRESSILDVGCAKGFMLHDFLEELPGVTVAGVDISEYTLLHSMHTVAPFSCYGNAKQLPFPDKSFDLVISIATIHNLELKEVRMALSEIERVSRKHSFIKINGYRSEEERIALEKWNIVAKTMLPCEEWIRIFEEVGYTGDYFWFTP